MTGRKHVDLRTSGTTSGRNKGNEATCREVSSEVLVDVFEGSWEVQPADGGAYVRFAARVDMGIPTLADVLEPIASRTLLDNTLAIIHGMFGPAVQLVDRADDAAVPDVVK